MVNPRYTMFFVLSSVERCNDIGQYIVHFIVVKLTRSRIFMTAAAVLQTKLAYIDLGNLVYYRFTDHDSGILLSETPCYMNGYLTIGIQ